MVLQYYGEKHLINIVLLLPMIVTEFWDFNLHVFFLLHYFYGYIYHTIAPIITMITCFIFLKYFRLLMNFRHPIYFVCGDFNANIRGTSQFGDELFQYCSDNSLCLADT